MRPGSFRTDADFGLAGAFHLPALDDAAEIEADAAPLAVGCGSGLVGCDGHRGWRAVSDFPDGRYDVDLNSYFLLNPAPENTQAAIAYDLASFLTFLWCNREPLGTRSLRDARPEDRDAYHRWRRIDERGPGVKGSTWRREVATVNSFYQWAVASGLVAESDSATRHPQNSRTPPHRTGGRLQRKRRRSATGRIWRGYP